MYSAKIVNDHAYFYAEEPVRLNRRLFATEAILPGIGGVLTSRQPEFDVSGRTAWLFISIKNHSFSRAYVNNFISLCETLAIEGYVCAVDTPYKYNAMAELGVDTLHPSDQAKIDSLSADFQRMVGKAIRGSTSKRVRLVQWSDLEQNTPRSYRDELANAFYDGTAVRKILMDHVAEVKQISDEAQIERFVKFFLCEVPVLLHTYYSNGATLDVYPGPQPPFFWQIELGELKSELPKLTALTQSDRPMLFLDTHNRRGDRK